MAFGIEEFKAAFGDRGGAMRDNRYVMTMVPPRCMLNGATRMEDVSSIMRDMEFWVDSVNIPGYQLALNVAKRWTYGPDEKRPYMPVFMPITCQFLSDGHGDYLRFFNDWMQYIMPHDWYNGGINQISNFGGRQYELEYKSEYATDITISVLSPDGNIVEIYYIKEAFPSLIADIPMSYNSTNQTAKFQVQFEYLDWTTTQYSPSVMDGPGNGIPGNGTDTPEPTTPIRAEGPNIQPPNGSTNTPPDTNGEVIIGDIEINLNP